MEFMGRIDANQVKIRGQRLELFEVEAAIARLIGIKDAAVGYHKPEGSLEGVLVSYIILDINPADEINGVKDDSSLVQSWADFYDDMYGVDNMCVPCIFSRGAQLILIGQS